MSLNNILDGGGVNYLMYVIPENDYIEHYGVLGMKWGHRKNTQKQLQKQYGKLEDQMTYGKNEDKKKNKKIQSEMKKIENKMNRNSSKILNKKITKDMRSMLKKNNSYESIEKKLMEKYGKEKINKFKKDATKKAAAIYAVSLALGSAAGMWYGKKLIGY